jgi:hypothetical protein
LTKVTVRGILFSHGAGYITAQFKSRLLLTTSYVLEEKVSLIGSPVFAEIVILTGWHASCFGAQSNDAGGVLDDCLESLLDLCATNWLGKIVGRVVSGGNIFELNTAILNEVSDKVKLEIHMFGSETVLADQTEGQIDCPVVVDRDCGWE